MARITNAVKALFKDDGWPVEEVEGQTALRLRFELLIRYKWMS